MQQAGGLVERELGYGLFGSSLGILSGSFARTGAEPMHGQRFHVDACGGLECGRESVVVRVAGRLRELGDDGLPDAFVSRLHHFGAVTESGADEALRAEQTNRRLCGLVDPHAAPTIATGSGLPPSAMISRSRRASRASAPGAADGRWRITESGRAASAPMRCRPLALALRASSSMRKGIPPDSRTMASAVTCAVGSPEPSNARARRWESTASSGPTAISALRAFGPPCAQLRQKRGASVLVAIREDEQERRGRRLANELEEQGRAVRIPPLDVVDVDDEGPRLRERRDEIAERVACTLSSARRVRVRAGRDRSDARHASKDREKTSERPGIGRQPGEPPALGQPQQVPAQRVDDAVNRLERNGLALVGASAQHHGLTALDQFVDEVLDDR